MEEGKKFFSELRMDVVSKDWVIVATNRNSRPNEFKKNKKNISLKQPKKDCPFCDISGQKTPTLVLLNGKVNNLDKKLLKDWTLAVIPNKYPALLPYLELEPRTEGNLYKKMNAVGFHEVVITRDHEKEIAELPQKKVKEIIDAWQMRYLDMKDKKFVNYISIFQNHGPDAGGSISHPHSQIITTVLLDVDLKNALSRAKKYHRENKRCLYCDMIKYDMKVKKRIVFENKNFVAICPFASKTSFQVIISPKKHHSHFEKITEEEKNDLAESLKIVLSKIRKGLNDPSYNFYLHTAPAYGKNHDYYHWHFTILPKVQNWAGFEIGTRVEIITVSPEEAADYLRKQ